MSTNHIEENVTIQGKYKLFGTLTLPKDDKQYPAVLFFVGSGQVDRDENHKMLKMNIFKELSKIFTDLGFVTLRYDKRGVGESEGDFDSTGFWDLVEDGEAALNFLQTHKNVNKDSIILVGHSEGAIIAPVINARNPVQGLILLAGVAESLRDTLKRQQEDALREIQNISGFKGFLFRLLKVSNKIEKMNTNIMERVANTEEDVIKIKGKNVNAKWMREHFNYNVKEDLAKVECLALVLTGTKDIQTPPEQVKDICSAIPGKTECHVIKDLNHILRKTKNEPSMLSVTKEYKTLAKKPIDEEVVNIIITWSKQFLD